MVCEFIGVLVYWSIGVLDQYTSRQYKSTFH